VGGKTIRPDGTFKDEMNLVRGYWEAKDTADKLRSKSKAASHLTVSTHGLSGKLAVRQPIRDAS
jgi:hypothetical protein